MAEPKAHQCIEPEARLENDTNGSIDLVLEHFLPAATLRIGLQRR